MITGGKAAGYRVGDTLNLTCTTVSINAQLHWFVNDQVVSTFERVFFYFEIYFLNFSFDSAFFYALQMLNFFFF